MKKNKIYLLTSLLFAFMLMIATTAAHAETFTVTRSNIRGCQIVGSNLIGNSFSNGDIYGRCDPEVVLGPLQDNGGPTPTHALVLGSLATDAGDNAFAVDPFDNTPLATDQRGFVRIIDGNNDGTAIVDIGTYEGPTATPPLNLLANSSFEQGDAPWEDWGNSIVFGSANAPRGGFELRIGVGAGGRNQVVAALPNTTYTLNGWGRVSQTGETGWIGVHHLDAAGNVVSQSLY